MIAKNTTRVLLNSTLYLWKLLFVIFLKIGRCCGFELGMKLALQKVSSRYLLTNQPLVKTIYRCWWLQLTIDTSTSRRWTRLLRLIFNEQLVMLRKKVLKKFSRVLMKSRFVSSVWRISRSSWPAFPSRAAALSHFCNLDLAWFSCCDIVKLSACIDAALVSTWCLLSLNFLIIFILALWESLGKLF